MIMYISTLCAQHAISSEHSYLEWAKNKDAFYGIGSTYSCLADN